MITGGVFAAAPANADPGNAASVGAAAVVSVHLGPIQFDDQNTVGGVAVANPGQDADSQSNVPLLDPGLASITLGQVDVAAQSSAAIAQAQASVTDTSANLFGISLVSLDTASSTATCPVGSDAQASVTAQGLTVLGIPVGVFDAADPAVEETTLPAAVQYGTGVSDVEDLSGVHIRVEVTQVNLSDSNAAVGVALEVQASVTGSYEETNGTTTTIDAGAPVVVASLLLAEATCETPDLTPITTSAITPDSGTVDGGQAVTVTGTGFTPETTVSFGSNPATSVVVDPSGTSLTAVTPAGTAGATTVTLTNPGGPTATLGYTYVADVAPVVPVVPADAGGTGTLAATGADPAPGIGLAAAMLALGILLMSARLIRRRA
jgi:hypothetical protein